VRCGCAANGSSARRNRRATPPRSQAAAMQRRIHPPAGRRACWGRRAFMRRWVAGGSLAVNGDGPGAQYICQSGTAEVLRVE
jgi:hypothetical protein